MEELINFLDIHYVRISSLAEEEIFNIEFRKLNLSVHSFNNVPINNSSRYFKSIIHEKSKQCNNTEHIKKCFENRRVLLLFDYFDMIKEIMEKQPKEINITIPEGYIIDEENSSLKDGIVKFKQLSNIPFEKIGHKIDGYWINHRNIICKVDGLLPTTGAKNVFKTEQLAKKAFAIAQISQWMPQYGGAITDKEWENYDVKYTIYRDKNVIACNTTHSLYGFLAFRTREFRNKFLKEHESLIRDYLMIAPTKKEIPEYTMEELTFKVGHKFKIKR